MTIHIDALEFETIIGILEFERLSPQRVCVQCHADYSNRNGAFLDYSIVADLIVKTMQEEQFELIETALEDLSALLKSSFPHIQKLYLRIDKPDILPNCRVGVSMEYSYND